jgi:hypothetical protein
VRVRRERMREVELMRRIAAEKRLLGAQRNSQ